MKKTEQKAMHDEFIPLLTRAQTAQKWEVFEKQTAQLLPTFLLTTNQLRKTVRKEKNAHREAVR